MTRDRLIGDLQAALGAQSVLEIDGHHRVRARDRAAACRAAELAAKYRRAWRPRGAGRRSDAERGPGLDLMAPEGILDLWADELVLRVAAGTRLAALDLELEPLGLRTGLAAFHPERATLGGILATAERGFLSGTGRGLRDRLLGLAVVDGRGTLTRSGGRVVKSVAGFDLSRLHHGARGALGLVLDFVLRLETIPEASLELLLTGDASTVFGSWQEARLHGVTDLRADLILGPGACALVGSPEEFGWLRLREGWRADLETWAEGDVRPLASGLDTLRGAFLRPGMRVLRWWRSVAELRAVAAQIPGLWVHDSLAGEGWWTGSEAEADVLARVMGSPLFDEVNPQRAAASGGRARAERRIREVYDPLGLLPALPEAPGAGRTS